MRQINRASHSLRQKLVLGIFALIFSLFGANVSSVLAQVEYNARNEFALTQGGTTGVWNYGFSNTASDNTFNLFTETRTTAPCSGINFEEWYRTGEAFDLPSIRRNTGNAPCFNISPEVLALHPSSSGRRAVVRWTAPAAGTFLVNGVFQGLDGGGGNGGTSTDVKILKNTTETLFSGNVSGLNGQQAFNFTVTVAAGDKLDFSVGYGANSDANNDSTGLALTIGQPVTACLAAPADLAVYIPAENSTADIIGQNFTGRLVGEAGYANAGKVGRAFTFDGTGDVVALDDKDNQDITGNLTIEAWVNPTAISGDQIIVDKRNFNNTNLNYALYLSNGALTFSSTDGATFRTLSAPGALPTGVYTHVAAVISGTDLIFYRNGVEIHRTAFNFPRSASSGHLQIGGLFLSTFTGAFFNGQIDEVSIYSRALSQTELFNLVKTSSLGKCPPAQCAQPPNNLVSWYQGENNALDSRSNNHGALQNGTTFSTGKVGQGIKFDGANDYVEIPDSPSLKPQTLTLETWVKFDSLTSTVTGGAPAGYQNIIFKKNSRPAGSGFEGGYSLVKNPNNVIGVGFNNPGGATNFANSTTAVQAGVWYHIAATHDGTTINLYINGQLEGSNPATFPIDYGTTPLYLGTSQVPFNGYFNGVLDETSIYNRALSASEVSSIYNANSSGKCKPVGLNPPTNQIAWFTGDGNARDFAGEDQNGIFAANNYAVGKVGQAFKFDGVDDFVAAPDDNALDITGDLTLEAWVNPTVYNTTMISKRDVDNSDVTYLLFLNSSGALTFASRQNGGGFQPDVVTTTAVPLNQFSHVAATIQGSTLRLYIDGIERGVSASYPARTASDGRLTIGAFETNVVASGIGGFYQGRIDEVGIYNRGLSASEISAVYNAGTAGKLKGKTTATGSDVTVPLANATVTFESVTTTGTTGESGVDMALLPPLPSNVTFTGLAFDISTTATYQNGTADDVRVCFDVSSLTGFTFSRLQIRHLEGGVWVNRTDTSSAAPTLCTDNLPSLSPFAIVEGPVGPTASTVSVSGRVLTGKRGVRNAMVTLIESDGTSRTILSGANGQYSFTDIGAGQNVIIRVRSKRYVFVPDTHVINVTEDMEEINFTTPENNLLIP